MIVRSEEHTSELQSRLHLVCRLLLEKKKVSIFLLPSPATDNATASSTPPTRPYTATLIISVLKPTLTRLFFFFNDTATTEIYTLSLHDALPISRNSTPRSLTNGMLARNAFGAVTVARSFRRPSRRNDR